MIARTLLLVLSAIGIAETIYLIRKRAAHKKPACAVQSCMHVLHSRYNRTFGMPNDALGLLFYSIIGVLDAFLLMGIEPTLWWSGALNTFVVIGCIFSLFFLYVQWRIIRKWCFWCSMSAVQVFMMTFIILIKGM